MKVTLFHLLSATSPITFSIKIFFHFGLNRVHSSFDRAPIESMPILMNIHDLQELIKLGRSATYQLTATADFPAPYAISGKALRWEQTEVLNWLERQRVKNPADRTRARKAQSKGFMTVNGVKFRSATNA